MLKIAMVVFSYCPEDMRVRRESEALASVGMVVDVFCLRKDRQLKNESVHGVNLYRINLKNIRGSKARYIFQYAYFLSVVLIKLSMLHLFKRYDIIHVHNMPDVLIFSAFFAKLARAKVILDIHDLMPELYMTLYSLRESHAVVRLLIILERLSIQFADLVITTNIAFRRKLLSRSCRSTKITIVMNSPQENIFAFERLDSVDSRIDNQLGFQMIYHGQILERHGLDIALKAVDTLRNKIPRMVLHVYGDGEYSHSVEKLVQERNLTEITKFYGNVPPETVAEAIKTVDVGIIPNKLNPFTDLNFPTRIFECLCLNKPVIVPRTIGICDYFKEDEMLYFAPDNVEDLSRVLLKAYKEPLERAAVAQRGRNIFKKHRWILERKHLVETIHLLAKGA